MSRVRRSCRRVTLQRSCSSPDQRRLLGALSRRHDGALPYVGAAARPPSGGGFAQESARDPGAARSAGRVGA
jgi:hypothetical protein